MYLKGYSSSITNQIESIKTIPEKEVTLFSSTFFIIANIHQKMGVEI
jgi:hypothetical protein